MRRAGTEGAFFLFYLALAVVLTWPLAIRLTTAVPDLGDPLLNAWILDWVSHALTHRPLDLFEAPIFHPAKLPLAFSENLIGIAVVALPFHLAGLGALTVYNIALLLGFAHAGYGGFVLGRLVAREMFGTRVVVPALVGGIFFGFLQYKFDQLSHLQVVWSGWVPLLLAAVIAYWLRPTWGRAAALGAAFLMNGLTNIHFLLFGGVATLLAMATLAILDWRGERRFWVRLAASLAVAGLLLLPVLLPYRTVAELYGMKRDRTEVLWGSAELRDWLYTTVRSRVYAPYQPEDTRHERMLFPGLVPLFLLGAAIVLTPRRVRTMEDGPDAKSPRAFVRALDGFIVALAVLAWFAAVTDRVVVTWGGVTLLAVRGTDIPLMLLVVAVLARLSVRFPQALGGAEGRSLRTAAEGSRFTPAAWAAAGWIAAGFLGSLGLNAFFHTFLYERVEGFAALRVPARWAIVAYAGLAAWAAIGAAALLRSGGVWRRRALVAVLPLIAIVEVAPRIQWEHAPVKVPGVYRWLNEVRLGPVLEMPPQDRWGSPYLYLLYATSHRVPIMNGTSGFEPPVHREIRDAYASAALDGAFTSLLERSGCRMIIVHSDGLAERSDVTRGWLREGLATGRLVFLRRLDNGIGGDWVFGVRRNLQDAATYRDYDSDPHLAPFLAGKPTYNATTFGRVDAPHAHERHHRSLRVSGWALSPHGIRTATVLIHNRKIRVPMELHERPDVSVLFPWYPATPRPGFAVTIPKRPKGVPRETDVQVEIVDGAGRTTLLRNTPLWWD